MHLREIHHPKSSRLVINLPPELCHHAVEVLVFPFDEKEAVPAPKDKIPFAEIMKRTRGLWKHGDGLDYQMRNRLEW